MFRKGPAGGEMDGLRGSDHGTLQRPRDLGIRVLSGSDGSIDPDGLGGFRQANRFHLPAIIDLVVIEGKGSVRPLIPGLGARVMPRPGLEGISPLLLRLHLLEPEVVLRSQQA